MKTDADLSPASALANAAKWFGADAGGGHGLYERVQSNLDTLARHRVQFAGVQEFVTAALEAGPLTPVEKMAIAETLFCQLGTHRACTGADEDNRLPRQSYAKRHATVSLVVAAIMALGGIRIGDNNGDQEYEYSCSLFNRFARLYIDYDGFLITRDNYDQFPDPEVTKKVALSGWAGIVKSFPESAFMAFLQSGLLCFLNTYHGNDFGWQYSDAPAELLRIAIGTGKISDEGLRTVLNRLNMWRRSYVEAGEAGISLLANVENLRAAALRRMKVAGSHLDDVYAPEFFALAADEDRRIGRVGIEALPLVFEKLSKQRRREAIAIFIGALKNYEDSDQRFRAADGSLVACRGSLTSEELGNVRRKIEELIAACDKHQNMRKIKLERLLENIPSRPQAPPDSPSA